jgi:hypothetical protein
MFSSHLTYDVAWKFNSTYQPVVIGIITCRSTVLSFLEPPFALAPSHEHDVPVTRR